MTTTLFVASSRAGDDRPRAFTVPTHIVAQGGDIEAYQSTDRDEIALGLMTQTKDTLLDLARQLEVNVRKKATKEVIAEALAIKLVENAIPNEPEPEDVGNEDDIRTDHLDALSEEEKVKLLTRFFSVGNPIDWSVFHDYETEERKIAIHHMFEQKAKEAMEEMFNADTASGSAEEDWTPMHAKWLNFLLHVNANLETPFLVSKLGELQSRKVRVVKKKAEKNFVVIELNTKDTETAGLCTVKIPSAETEPIFMYFHFHMSHTFQNLFDVIKEKQKMEIGDDKPFLMKHAETKSTAVSWETLSSWANVKDEQLHLDMVVSVQLMGGGKSIKKDKELKELDAKLRVGRTSITTKASEIDKATVVAVPCGSEVEAELGFLLTEIDQSKSSDVLQSLVNKLDYKTATTMMEILDATKGTGEYRLSKIAPLLLGENSRKVEETYQALGNVRDLGIKVVHHAFLKAIADTEGGFSIRHFRKMLEIRKYTSLGAEIVMTDADL